MLYSKQYTGDLLSQLPDEIAVQLKGKRIAITGASGLICSYIIDALMEINREKKTEIYIYALGRNIESLKERFKIYNNNQYLQFVKYNIFEPFPVMDIDFIIHGASPAYPKAFADDPVGTMNSNYLGMLNILESARVTNTRILFISSAEIYGKAAEEKTWEESESGSIDPLKFRSCYPISKRAAETLCAAYKEQFNVDFVTARPCHVFGPTMTVNDNRAISSFIRNAVKNEPIIMKSEGTAIRSYCYAGDCFSAIIHILLFGKSGEAYNISNEDNLVSVGKAADIISLIGNIDVIIDIPGGDVKTGFSTVDKIIISSQKLKNLGWKAKTTLEDGLKKTITTLRCERE
ncbi:hypothetical protein AGMMS49928_13990 [Spirochaetia bacterium]|nr:hypothetical protein AGMMS49928_13990 [Spirochaetia bacterium]